MNERFISLFKQLISYGISSDLEGMKRWQIMLLQQMALTFIPTTLVFVVFFAYNQIYASAVLMCAVLLTNVAVIFLNKREAYTTSRLLESILPISFIFLSFIINYPQSTAVCHTFSLYIFAYFIIPFIYFSLEEWRYILTCCLLYLIMLIAFYQADGLFTSEKVDYGSLTSTLVVLNHICSLLILVSGIFYLIIIINKYYLHSEDQKQEILSQAEEIQFQQEEITKQRDGAVHLREQNIKSFLYAQKIQRIVLPSENLFQKWFADYFILYNPLEYVSGDFYWTHNEGHTLYVVVADCTGHGFPGALMSMLGISLLNEVFHKNEVREPQDILDKLREHLLEALHINQATQHTSDGMDVSLVKIDFDQKKLWYAGANRPLVIIRKHEVFTLDPDKMPIGFHPILSPFSQQEFELRLDDKIYLFTDGFYDQFGGDKNKKFKQKQFKSLLSSISHLPMNEQKILIDKMFDSWRGYHDQVDDITIVGLVV